MKESHEVAKVYETIGRRLHDIRKAKGITQAVVASEAGLTRQSVANIEHGRQRFMVHTLLDAARALGVPPTDLLPQPEGSEVTMDLIEKLESHTARQFVLSVLQPTGASLKRRGHA